MRTPISDLKTGPLDQTIAELRDLLHGRMMAYISMGRGAEAAVLSDVLDDLTELQLGRSMVVTPEGKDPQ